MKSVDWVNAGLFLLLAICFGAIVYGIIEYNTSKDEPLKPQESFQKTLIYTGFDGKKHQAIVINCGQQSWVLVEKK